MYYKIVNTQEIYMTKNKQSLMTYAFILALTLNIISCQATSTGRYPSVNATIQAAQQWAQRNQTLLAGIATLLAGIIIWQYTQQQLPQPPFIKVYNINGTRFTIKQGFIQNEQTDMLVNAANEKLKKGSGVCQSIFTAAGEKESLLTQVCKQYITDNNEVQAGQAVYTGIDYPEPSTVKGIIHAVSPTLKPSVYQPTLPANQETSMLLQKAYESALKLTTLIPQINSVAFPLLGSGAFGFDDYDNYDAINSPVRPALQAIVNFAKENHPYPKDIRLVLFTNENARKVDQWFNNKYPQFVTPVNIKPTAK